MCAFVYCFYRPSIMSVVCLRELLPTERFDLLLRADPALEQKAFENDAGEVDVPKVVARASSEVLYTFIMVSVNSCKLDIRGGTRYHYTNTFVLICAGLFWMSPFCWRT